MSLTAGEQTGSVTTTSPSVQPVNSASHPVMLAAPMSTISRSQAGALAALAGAPGWVHDLKLDGIRALVTVHGLGVQILNRRGADITFRYPDVVAEMSLAPWGVYDGEIVCVVGGQVDFPAIHKRDAQNNPTNIALIAKTTPAQFVAFDLLRTSVGTDITTLPLARRREQLIETGVPVVPFSSDLRALWAVVEAGGLEGVVSKKLTSTYTGKRSRDWVKIKQQHSVTCVVIAVAAGEGRRQDSIGSLKVAVIDTTGGAAAFREIADVGSGMTDAQLHEAWAVGDVIEVGYLDVSPRGFLRQPVFLRRRGDVDVTACTFEQLALDLTRQKVQR